MLRLSSCRAKIFLFLLFTFPLMIVLSFLHRCSKACDEKELKLITDIRTQIKDKQNVFFDMEAYLPKRNGSVLLHFAHYRHWVLFYFLCLWVFCVCVVVSRLYLNLVLGNVNVTLLSNQAKYVKYSAFRTAWKMWFRLRICVSSSFSPPFIRIDLPTKTSMRSSSFIWQ